MSGLEIPVHGRQAVHAGSSRSAQWNRGAYLVNSLGHCAECHSPRNFLGGIVEAQRFAGGPNPEGEGWVPNITQKRMSDWSAKDFAYFLESGSTPEGDTAGGSMARVIRNTSQLSPEDRAAMAEYLKSLPPVEGPPRPKKAGEVLMRFLMRSRIRDGTALPLPLAGEGWGLGWGSIRESSCGESPHPALRADLPRKRER